MGKTTCAAAAAVAAARAGRRVLAVSTDPAHSLGDALDMALGPEPIAVPLPVSAAPADGGELLAVEPSAARSWRRWLEPRRRLFVEVAERGSLLDAADAESLLALPLPGVDELVGLAEAARLAGEAGCSEVVVDTAPTGHTLRLLAAPRALGRLGDLLAALEERHRVLGEHFARGGAVAPDEAARAVAAVAAEAETLQALATDPDRGRFTWVTLAEEMAVEETLDALAALAEAGVAVERVVVNRWLGDEVDGCPACAARAGAQQAAVERLAREHPTLPLVFVADLPREPRGTAGLLPVAEALAGEAVPAGQALSRRRAVPGEQGSADHPAAAADLRVPAAEAPATADSAAALGELGAPPPWLAAAVPPGLRLLLVGGKGGVGKTTCAAALGLLAAVHRPETPVRLLSTDPAHSLGDALALRLGDEERPVPLPSGAPLDVRITAREVDAGRAWNRWRERLREEAAGLLTWEGGRGGVAATLDRDTLDRLLDATPPGLDELAALSALVEQGGDDAEDGARDGTGGAEPLLVVDTAPTGHALRLLELPGVALDWIHALMRLLLKYREAVRLGELAEELLDLSRRIKRLQARLGDPVRTRFLPVARLAELPRRESERLLDALQALGIAAPWLLVNAVPAVAPGGLSSLCGRCVREAAAADAERAALALVCDGRCAMLEAPLALPPPRGADRLLPWAATWNVAETP